MQDFVSEGIYECNTAKKYGQMIWKMPKGGEKFAITSIFQELFSSTFPLHAPKSVNIPNLNL